MSAPGVLFDGFTWAHGIVTKVFDQDTEEEE
jgi:hypothetical protein